MEGTGRVPRISLVGRFTEYAKLGNRNASGRAINLSQAEQWLQDTRLLGSADGTINIHVLSRYFHQQASGTMGFYEFMTLIDTLANEIHRTPQDIKRELLSNFPHEDRNPILPTVQLHLPNDSTIEGSPRENLKK